MAQKTNSASLRFVDELGRYICDLEVFSPASESLIILGEEEARSYGEERVQLIEDRVYEYIIRQLPAGWKLHISPVIIPSKISTNSGRIEPGPFTGILPIGLYSERTRQNAFVRVEVRSAKLNYRDDYRRMLDDIATFSTDLVVDIRAPSQIRLLPDLPKSPETLQQRFAFLQSTIGTREFHEAIQRIVGMPHSRLQQSEEKRDSRRVGKITQKNLRQIAQDPNRIPLDEMNPLYSTMRSSMGTPSLPTTLSQIAKQDTRDTLENRFVKHTLMTFVNFLVGMEQLVPQKDPTNKRLRDDIQHLREQLDSYLARDFFRGISQLQFIPLSSPVLQRKPGYREILSAWLKFNIAASLVWRGGEDVYGAGKRSVSNLYEYWVFFALLKLIRKHFEIDSKSLQALFEKRDQGLGLKLKSGQSLAITGSYSLGERPLKIIFSYNRTFSSTQLHTMSGSWTRRMRPDYTLSIYPAAFTPAEAEAQSLMVHIHFDAKYKVEALDGLFGSEAEEQEGNGDEISGRGTAKRDDLLKMHAYLDAIRRSEGAYVIYPGSQNQRWQEYQEILPGLGAFRLRPGDNGKIVGGQDISKFIGLIIEHIRNRATRWERQNYHEHRIQSSPPPFNVFGPVPELKPQFQRIAPLSEQGVLVERCLNKQQAEWINTAGKYALKLNASVVEPSHVNAEYIFVIGLRHPLLKISSHAPKAISFQDALNLNYPVNGTEVDLFLIYEVEPANSFVRWNWNESALAAIGEMIFLTLDHLLFLGDFQ